MRAPGFLSRGRNSVRDRSARMQSLSLITQLERLQGIKTVIAERFSDEGISTICQLAYCDPDHITMAAL
jgi:hypothetical protein